MQALRLSIVQQIAARQVRLHDQSASMQCGVQRFVLVTVNCLRRSMNYLVRIQQQQQNSPWMWPAWRVVAPYIPSSSCERDSASTLPGERLYTTEAAPQRKQERQTLAQRPRETQRTQSSLRARAAAATAAAAAAPPPAPMLPPAVPPVLAFVLLVLGLFLAALLLLPASGTRHQWPGLRVRTGATIPHACSPTQA